MKRAIKILIVLVVLAGVGWGAYRMYQLVQERKAAAARQPSKEALKVAVVRVRTGALEKRAAVTGEIQALQVVDVTPKVIGCLQRLRLPDGTLLEEGTVIQPDAKTKKLPVIAVIEHEALKAALEKAQAAAQVAEAAVATAHSAVESARAAVQVAKVTLADCKREKARMEGLFKGGSATEKQVDAAAAEYDRAVARHTQAQAGLSSAKARVTEAEAGRAQARAAVRQAEVALADATIAAPIAGIVIRRHVDEGNMVGPTTPLVGRSAWRSAPPIPTAGSSRACSPASRSCSSGRPAWRSCPTPPCSATRRGSTSTRSTAPRPAAGG